MSVKENVLNILKAYPAAEKNTDALAILYWVFCDDIKIPPYIASKIINEATPYESISRAKRFLKEQGMI